LKLELKYLIFSVIEIEFRIITFNVIKIEIVIVIRIKYLTQLKLEMKLDLE